jgi:hypothetical protein
MGGRHAVFACFVVSALFVTLLFSVVRAAPEELPQLKLDVSPTMAFAPADVVVVVIAKPDDANRTLALGIGATDAVYASSSQKSLNGSDERGQLASVTYRRVPAGNYLVVAALYDRDGKMLAQASKAVRRLSRED